MLLKNIQIENFRSLDKISFDVIENSDSSYTYGLIGVNEAGKSSILKALSLKNNLSEFQLKDFKDRTKPVIVQFRYQLDAEESNSFREGFEIEGHPSSKIERWDILTYRLTFNKVSSPQKEFIISSLDAKHAHSLGDKHYDATEEFQKTVFWTADNKYLISLPIDLSAFAANPDSVSIPLKNCFLLAGIENIADRISLIKGDSTEIEHLQELLGTKVTEHIKSVWPDHPITITFIITDGFINFHVKDGQASKAKTADQRSDGFKQFISFLLTISAENKNGDLTDTILLLDEPETHLHPQAQEYLLNELKKITQNDRGNTVLFATHSNYMIDKEDLSKNFRVSKKNETTFITQFHKQSSTYASVTYEVFDIVSSDYHNQLYAKLHVLYQDENPDDENREKIKNFDENYFVVEKKLPKDQIYKGNPNSCSLPTFIRNCIHHPDNGNTFTEKQLRNSIEKMREFLSVS